MMPVREYALPAGRMVEWPDHVHHFLCDGSECVYYAPYADEGYRAVAREMGYADAHRYTVEHEIGHHWIAEHLPPGKVEGITRWTVGERTGPASRALMRVSRILYHAAHKFPMSMDEPESAAEEHLVNRLQRYANLGEPDPYGELERVFGDCLPKIARKYVLFCRPWLVT